MHKIFAIVALLIIGLAVATPAAAQYRTTIYTDSTLAGVLHASNAATAAAIARGFSDSTTLSSDFNSHTNRYIQIRFRGKTSATLAAATSFTKDSVKIQGRFAKTSSALNLDKIWTDIPVTYPLTSAINTGAGSRVVRDTTCIWIAADQPGVDASTGYISPLLEVAPIYDEYRVVNGKADSGRVIIREVLERVR